VTADPFLIRWQDVHGNPPAAVNAQASEQAYGFGGDWLDLAFSDGMKLTTEQNDGKGLFGAQRTSDKADLCTVTGARKVGPHDYPVLWRIVAGGTPFKAGSEEKLQLSTRLRISLNGFDASFVDQQKQNGRCDPGLMALLKVAPLDDVSLVDTVDFDAANPGEVKWSKGFQPLGSPKWRVPYLKDLIAQCHDFDIQVGVGYAIVDQGQDIGDLGKNFAFWLTDPTNKDKDKEKAQVAARQASITAHGQKILDFFLGQGLHIDGVTFDFECNSLRLDHAANMKLLIQSTAKAFAPYNKWVAYDNKPFLGPDGGDKNDTASMRVQPYNLCAGAPNLIARPMCYNGVQTPFNDVVKSIGVALSQASGGGMLHPSQLQMAFRHWGGTSSTPRDEILKQCRETLRPNRVGLVLYPIPNKPLASNPNLIDQTDLKTLLKGLKDFDDALNPNEPRRMGQPLQAPKRPKPDPADTPTFVPAT
jgi:hypothetical protein